MLRKQRISGAVIAFVSVAIGLLLLFSQSSGLRSQDRDAQGGGIHKIRHVITIMQENRSFDSYFGTFPGADGIPMRNGEPSVCVNDPAANKCVKPYHDANDANGGGPHGGHTAIADVNGGRMDGFIALAERAQRGCLGSDP